MTDENLTQIINQPYDSFINPEIHSELVKLAKHALKNNKRSNTLNTCDVVNNAVIKIYNHKSGMFRSRGHFYALMTQIMRNLVIDHIRSKMYEKRSGGYTHVTLSQLDSEKSDENKSIERLLDIENSIQKLGQQDKQLEQIITMKFYGDVEIREIADFLSVSESTVKRKLRFARACMKSQLDSSE